MGRVFLWSMLAISAGLFGWAVLDDWTVIDQLYLGFCGLTFATLSVVFLRLSRSQRALSAVSQLATEINKLKLEPEPTDEIIKRSRNVQLNAAQLSYDTALAALLARNWVEATRAAAAGAGHINDFRQLRNPLKS